jgi:hypothetical protein
MNVSLTRAKLYLWILGNARTLQTNHNWAIVKRDLSSQENSHMNPCSKQLLGILAGKKVLIII